MTIVRRRSSIQVSFPPRASCQPRGKPSCSWVRSSCRCCFRSMAPRMSPVRPPKRRPRRRRKPRANAQARPGTSGRKISATQSPERPGGADQGAKGSGRLALLGAQGDAGLVGEHDGRPQGPSDRLGPVRQAVPRDAAADRRRRPSDLQGRADRRRRSARPTGCSGRSIACTSSSTAAADTTAGSTASATPTATTGSTRSSCSASSTAAASTGRTR